MMKTTTSHEPGGFWATAFAYALVMIGGTIPIPLWHAWSVDLGFGPFLTTLAFAVYAVGTVAALTLFAKASDQVGRRAVILAGLALAIVSSALLAQASAVAVILVARVLSGIGAGLVTASASAALVELAGERRRTWAPVVATLSNVGGLGGGVLIAASAVQLGGETADTIRWLYVGYVATVLLAAVGLLRATETVEGATWQRFAPSVRRPTLPADQEARNRFAWGALAVFVAFAVAGLFSSLVPSFLHDQVRVTAPLPAGLVVTALFAAALTAQLVAPQRVLDSVWTAPGMLILGTVGYEAGLLMQLPWLFVVGTVIAGAGFGLAFRRGLQIAQEVAPADRRADQMATYFLAAYAGNVLPTLALGIASQTVGDLPASVALAAAVVLGAAAAATGSRRAEATSARRRAEVHVPNVAATVSSLRATVAASLSPTITTVSHIGLTVPDIDAAVAWYRDVLRFTVLQPAVLVNDHSPNAPIARSVYGKRWHTMRQAHMSTANGVGVEFFEFVDPPEEPALTKFDYQRPGFFHLCLVSPDVDGLARRIADNGGEQRTKVWTASSMYRMCYCADPWGNAIEINDHTYERAHVRKPNLA